MTIIAMRLSPLCAANHRLGSCPRWYDQVKIAMEAIGLSPGMSMCGSRADTPSLQLATQHPDGGRPSPGSALLRFDVDIGRFAASTVAGPVSRASPLCWRRCLSSFSLRARRLVAAMVTEHPARVGEI